MPNDGKSVPTLEGVVSGSSKGNSNYNNNYNNSSSSSSSACGAADKSSKSDNNRDNGDTLDTSDSTSTLADNVVGVILGGGKGRMTAAMAHSATQSAPEVQKRWREFKVWLATVESSRIDTYTQGQRQRQGGKVDSSSSSSLSVNTGNTSNTGNTDTIANKYKNSSNNNSTSGGGYSRAIAQEPRYQYKYDVVIDGANVGFFKQNYVGAGSHVDFKQIDWMIRYLQRMYVQHTFIHIPFIHSSYIHEYTHIHILIYFHTY